MTSCDGRRLVPAQEGSWIPVSRQSVGGRKEGPADSSSFHHVRPAGGGRSVGRWISGGGSRNRGGWMAGSSAGGRFSGRGGNDRLLASRLTDPLPVVAFQYR